MNLIISSKDFKGLDSKEKQLWNASRDRRVHSATRTPTIATTPPVLYHSPAINLPSFHSCFVWGTYIDWSFLSVILRC